MKKILFLIILTVSFVKTSFSQNIEIKEYAEVINYIEEDYQVLNNNTLELKHEDLSHLWGHLHNSLHLGFIGANYRRLKMNFNQIVKNPYSDLEYLVSGKSQVSENICEFIGVLKIEKSFFIKTFEMPKGNHGILLGTYIIKENRTAKHSGIFEGKFSTYWYKNSKGEIIYDDTWYSSASFNNNQFSGTWKGYEKSIKQVANWGDGRIPNSSKLDVGSSEFYPSKEYINNGWEEFN